MDIYMYKNSAEKIVLNKDSYLSSEIHLSGYLRDECDIINPVIEISKAAYSKIWYGTETVDVQSTGQDVMSENPYAVPEHNYIYIPKFKRYYFVDNITSVRKGLWRISMSVDVLMSFRDKINNLTGIVKRSTIATRQNMRDEAAIVTPYYSFEKYDSIVDSPILQNGSYDWGIVTVVINNEVSNPTRYINDIYYYNYPDRIVARRNSAGQCNNHPSNFKFLMDNSRSPNARMNQMDVFLWYVARSDQQSAVISIMIYPFDFTQPPFFEDITVGTDSEYLEYNYSFSNPRGLYSIYQPALDIYSLVFSNFGIGSSEETVCNGVPLCNTFNNKILIGRIDCTDFPVDWTHSKINSRYLLYIPLLGYREVDYSKIVGKYVEVYFIMNWDDGSANVLVISTPSIASTNRFNVMVDNDYVVTPINGILERVQCNLSEGVGLRDELIVLEENVQIGISVPYSASNAAENSRKREAYSAQFGASLTTSVIMAAVAALMMTSATGLGALMATGGIVSGLTGAVTSGVNYASQEYQLIDITTTLGNLGNVAATCQPNAVHLLRCFYEVTYPSGYEDIVGKIDLTTRTISNIPNGYVQFAHIHVDGVDTATSNELDQIERELMNGILIN